MEAQAMEKWDVELAGMPQFARAMERIEAWYAGEILDRAPVRFSVRRPAVSAPPLPPRDWPSLRARWMDIEYRVESYLRRVEGRTFAAESFPVFFPDLGPGIYAALFGCPLLFGEGTSWTEPCLEEAGDARALQVDWQNEYLRTIDAMTDYALARCKGHALVGYTDLHPGLDCVADWRDPERLCFDLYDDPEGVEVALRKADEGFLPVYDYFHDRLRAHGQPSVSWIGIPSFGKMHIPSCDFTTMISPEQFRRFCLPSVLHEVRAMTHNIWHLDGEGCARHLDDLLQIPEIQAIQWVQGAGRNEPIMPWVPLIHRILAAGKSVVVGLRGHEVEPFMQAVPARGVLLCVDVDDEAEQDALLRRIERWR